MAEEGWRIDPPRWGSGAASEQGAFAALRRTMALGNTRPLPELFVASGLPFAFDVAAVANLVAAVEARLVELTRRSTCQNMVMTMFGNQTADGVSQR